MLNGDRLRNYTVGFLAGLALAILVGLSLWRGASDLENQITLQAQKEAAQYADPARISVECKASSVAAPAQQDCISPESEAASEAERNTYDLEAQQTVAVWTRVMGKAAIIGMGVGIIGLFLIFTTFWETRKAAQTSRDTYEAFIALESPLIAPKITLDHVQGKSHFGIKIEATNLGKTSCVVEKIYVSWTDKPEIPEFEGKAPWERHVLVAPEATEEVYESFGDKRMLKDGHFYSGYIAYRSPLKREHRAHFCVECALMTVGSGSERREAFGCFDRLRDI